MSMTKIIDPSGWGWDRSVVMPIKISSRGLVGSDRDDFVKIASHVFLPFIDNLKIAADEYPVHCVALGATEGWNCNRNGDGFLAKTCRDCHHTFEKYAKWYRNHRNKMADGDPYYGYIKKSAYNENMQRVELLGILNATKSAAERNGGFVADKEIEKIARDGHLDTSMACKIAYDVCSGCHNKARTRDEYCTEKTCKYGGCAENLTRVASDGHVLHVDNPNPVWFDNSTVHRHADRIAVAGKADWLQKAASHQFMPGAWMAEQVGIQSPLHLILAEKDPLWLTKDAAAQIKLAYGLAELEKDLQLEEASLRGMPTATLNLEQLQHLGIPGTQKCAADLAVLAEHKIILPLQSFAYWLHKEADYAAAADLLSSVFQRLIKCDDLETKLASNRFAPDRALRYEDVLTGNATHKLARDLAPSLSFEQTAVRKRAMLSSIRDEKMPVLKTGFWNQKQAADCLAATSLAEEYAMYKLAALYRMAGNDEAFNLTARLAVGQNRVS